MSAQSQAQTPRRRSNGDAGAARALARVTAILQEVCERDGQGSNLQETSRRKAYRAGINRALVEIDEWQARRAEH